MSSYSLTILGTDFIGLSLAQTFIQEQDPELLSLVGDLPTDDQKNDLQSLFTESDETLERFPEAFEGETDIREVVETTVSNLRQKLGYMGGQLVDLKVDTDGFVLLLKENEELKEIFTHHLIVTAPPVLDLLDNGLDLPGTDSAVTGLLLDKIGLDVSVSTDVYSYRRDDEKKIWDLDFGFKTDNSGGTSNMKVSATGQATEGPTTADALSSLVESFDTLSEPTTHYNESFDKQGWEDTSMPEGFVETKMNTLRKLLGDVLESDESADALTQKLEGLAGEVDSYSRFRSDPELQRLRWKTLAGMNFARSFLNSDLKAKA